MKKILIDADPGVDDALAILLALNSPELSVEAITTVSGNIHVDQATENLFRILGLLKISEYPLIAKGENKPLVLPLLTAAHVHGEDGLGNVSTLYNQDGNPLYPPADADIADLSGAELILEMVDRYADELTLVALGPLTNIALAIRKDPTKMRKLNAIVLMGGVFREYGNVTTTAEFNIYVDPHAAHEVFSSGITIQVAPLDVTHQVVLTGEHLSAETEEQQCLVSSFLRDSTEACMEFYRQHVGFYGLHIHDALPICMLTHPHFFKSIDAYVQVETEGHLTRGMTIADLRDSRQKRTYNANICIDVDADTFLNHFFSRLIPKSKTNTRQ